MGDYQILCRFDSNGMIPHCPPANTTRTLLMSLLASWKTSTTQCRRLSEILPRRLTHRKKMRQGGCNTGSWLLQTCRVIWRTDSRCIYLELRTVLCQEAVESAEATWHALAGCRSDATFKADGSYRGHERLFEFLCVHGV